MKPGDLTRWADVPDGAMVRSDPPEGFVWHYVRLGDRGSCVGCGPRGHIGEWGSIDFDPRPEWEGWNPPDHPVTIVALGLTGHESATDLRALAEAVDPWRRSDMWPPGFSRAGWLLTMAPAERGPALCHLDACRAAVAAMRRLTMGSP